MSLVLGTGTSGGGGGGTPGGSNKQVQYNNSSAFGGATGFEWQSATPNVLVTAQNATHVPLQLSLAGSQSANAFEIRSSTPALGARFDANSDLIVQPFANSTATFQVLRTAGTNGLTFDTSNNHLTVHSSGGAAGRLVIENSGAGADYWMDTVTGAWGDEFRMATGGTVHCTLESTGILKPRVGLEVYGDNAGSESKVQVTNISNTADSHAALRMSVRNGDRLIDLLNNAAGTRWSVGVDHSDSEKFKLATGWHFGSGVFFSLSRNGELILTSGGASYVPVVVRGQASHSANLQNWENSAGTALMEVESGGELDFRWSMGNSTKDPTTDAPADWVQVKISGTSYYLPAYAAS